MAYTSMKDEDDARAEDVEEPLLPLSTTKKSKQGKRRKAWYRRRLVVASAIALALVVIAYMIILHQVPHIAASAIQDTKMVATRMELTHPQSNSVTLNISLSLMSSSSFQAQVSSTSFAIYYADYLVGSFLVPAMTIHHGENQQIFPNATLTISNNTNWDVFARDMIQLEKVAYQIKGKLDIQVPLLGGLIHFHAANVPLEKTLTFNGMHGLRRMRIVRIQMTNSTQTKVLANIKTCIYNPSITTLRPVGSLCLQAHYPTAGNETLVARLVTPENTSIPVAEYDRSHPYCAALGDGMERGYNLLIVTGEMLSTYPEAISGLISKYLSNIPADLAVETCQSQATTVDLYNRALQNLSIPTQLPPQKDPLIGRMFFNGITLRSPPKGKEDQFVDLDTAVAVEATSPLGPHSPLTISSVRMNVTLFAALGDHDVGLGELSTLHVDIINGRLVERSNISVNCWTRLMLEERGGPFGAFVRNSVTKNQVSIALSGHMDIVAHGALGALRLSWLPINVTTILRGMDNFSNVSIKSFVLPGNGSASQHSENIETHISIWNPSIFTVAIGKLAMALGLKDSSDVFGHLNGPMNIAPGSNVLIMTGILNPAVDSRGRVSDKISQFFSRYLRGESSNVAVNITSTEYGNCYWMQKALLGLKIGSVFPGVSSGFELISEIYMQQLDVIMDEANMQSSYGESSYSNTRMRVRTDLLATVKMPSSIKIPLDITNLSVALTMENSARQPLGVLVSQRESCEFNQSDGGSFRLNLTNYYPIDFQNTAQVRGMAGFITNLLTKHGNVMLRLASDSQPNQGAFPYVETRMGMLSLQNIPIAGAPLIPAMDSFRDPPLRILSVDIKEGLKTSMILMMTFAIQNPSVVQTGLGNLALNVLAENARMGVAKIKNFNLKCCGEETILSGIFEFNPQVEDFPVAQRFLSNFVCGYFTDGGAQEIAIKGSTNSTKLDILQPALAALTIPTTLPPLAQIFPATPTLVTSSMLYMPSIFHLNRIPTSMELRNPFSEDITITKVDLELFPCKKQSKVDDVLVCTTYYDQSLARFAPSDFAPMFIPAAMKGCFSCCQGANCDTKMTLCPHANVGECMNADVQSFFSPEAIATIFRSMTTGLLMKVNGTITTSIGKYQTQLFYQQEGLLVTMAK